MESRPEPFDSAFVVDDLEVGPGEAHDDHGSRPRGTCASQTPRLSDHGIALAPPPPEDRVSEGVYSRRLKAMADEIAAIAGLVEARSMDPGGPPPMISGGFVRAVIKARRARAEFLRAELFLDPAWDMMLDLLAAHLEGRRIPVLSLCIAGDVSPTTGLRWIEKLAANGLVVRTTDPADRRRIFAELTPIAIERLTSYLREAPTAAI